MLSMRNWPGGCVTWQPRSGRRPHSCFPGSPGGRLTKSWPSSWPDAKRPGGSGTLPQPTVSESEWLKPASSSKTSRPDQSGEWRPPTDAGRLQMPPGTERNDAGGGGDAIPGPRAGLEALRARRPLRQNLIGPTTHGGTIRDILEEARRQDIVVQFVDGRRLDSPTQAARPQGVVALTSARPLVSVEDVLAAARTRQQPPFVLVLDGVEDPANLGAIIRTAEGAGGHGVIIPKHRAAGLTPAEAQTSAGAQAYPPVAPTTNLLP